MHERILLYLIPYMVSVSISAMVGLLALRRRDVPGAGAFGWMALSQAAWTLGYLLELASATLKSKIFWDDAQFIAGVGWFMGFFFFTIAYTGYLDRYTTGARAIIIAPAFVFVVLVLASGNHNWLRTAVALIPGDPFTALVYDFTIFVWIWAFYGYGIVILGIILLVLRFIRSQQLFRVQISIIIAGTLIPLIGTALTLVGVTFTFHRDTTPITFAISNIMLAWGLFRFRLFAVAPVGRHVVVDNLPDSVVVLDAKNRVVDFNRAAQSVMGREYGDIIGLPVSEAFAPWQELVKSYEHVEDIFTEISIPLLDGLHEYEFSVAPLRNRHGNLIGRVVVVREITARKIAEAELRKHRENLEQMVAARTVELQSAVHEAQQLNINLQQHDVILRAVGTATERLLKTEDWEEDIDDILALLGEVLNVDSVVLFRKQIDANQVLYASLTNEWCAEGITSFIDEPRFKNVDVIAVGYGRMLEIWNKGQAFYGRVSDMTRRERVLQRVWGIVSFVHMPIFVQDALWGVVSFNLNKEERTWSTAIIEALHTAANILGAVIERQIAQKALHRYVERLRVLREIDQNILAAESPDAIAGAVLERIHQLAPCQWAGVVLADLPADRAVLFSVQMAGGSQTSEITHTSIENFSQYVPPDLLEGKVYTAGDLGGQGIPPLIEEILMNEGIQSNINIPLMLQGELVGILSLGFANALQLSFEQMEAAQAAADQLAIAIQQARLHGQIKDHAADLELRVAERTNALEVANENLRALSLVKDQFVSNVSHELRTPITSLRLYHELLLKRPERQDEYIQALQRETERLTTLVEDVLTLSRMDQDRTNLVYDTVDINALAHEYVKDRVILAQDKGLVMTFAGTVEPLLVIADRNQMGQVIGVLLTNAVNYTPSGGKIMVRTLLADTDGRKWAGISVRDTGPGIALMSKSAFSPASTAVQWGVVPASPAPG